MKFIKIIILSLLFILTVSKLGSFKRFQKKNLNKYTSKEINMAQRYVTFAQLPYCKTEILEENTNCQICNNLASEGYKFKIKAWNRGDLTFHTIFSLKDGVELIISFSGPNSTDPKHIEYIQDIYRSKIIKVPELGNELMEEEFWEVYSRFRKAIHKTVEDYNNLSIKIIGHSFGAVMANLCAHDLVINKLASVDNLQIITYAALKRGDEDFGQIVYKAKPIHITNAGDFYSKIPNCIYSSFTFHCYKQLVWPVLNDKSFKKDFFQSYTDHYKTLIRQFPNFTKGHSKNFGNSLLTRKTDAAVGFLGGNDGLKYSFLEKSASLSLFSKEDLEALSHICKNKGEFWECKENPIIHRVHFKVDVERCG
jgi:hypothetical protein